MSYIAGDIKEIKVQHPDLGSKILEPKTQEDAEFDAGGIRVNDDDAQVTSSGTPIIQMQMTRGYIQPTFAWDAETMEFIKGWSKSGKLATVTFTLMNNDVYSGEAIPVGDIKPSIQNGTMQVKIAGKQFTKI